MKILFDNQTFVIQNRGGISRYFYEIITEIRNLGEICILPFSISNNIYLNSILYKSTAYVLNFIYKILRSRLRSLNFIRIMFQIFDSICDVFCLIFLKYDIFHPTYYNTYFLRFLNKRSVLVITVYDMIDEIYHKNNLKIIISKKKLIERSDKIIAISQNTKNDILKIYNYIPEDKISIIYLGVSMSDRLINERKVDFGFIKRLPEKYILYVGVREGCKNFLFFCKTISKILKDDCDLSVVCIGGNAFKKEEINLLSQLNIIDKFSRFDINDDTLFYTYKKAKLFIFPSIYEGFGIPVLEAFSAGCPVASSNRSSLREVCGDAVEYFDPENEESMIRAVNNILHNNIQRLHLIKLGYKRVKFFSWHKSAKKTLKVYKNAFNKKASQTNV